MSQATPPDKLVRDRQWRLANAAQVAEYNNWRWRLVTCYERKLAKASSFTERRKLEAAIARGKVTMTQKFPLMSRRKGK